MMMTMMVMMSMNMMMRWVLLTEDCASPRPRVPGEDDDDDVGMMINYDDDLHGNLWQI